MKLRKSLKPVFISVLFFIATLPGFAALEDLATAELAQVLIAKTWAMEDPNALPWPWADTRPVARIKIDSLDLDALVLGGGNGHALAFGPGMTEGSVAPGTPGVTLFSAHRDTHFCALEHVTVGTEIKVQGIDRHWHYYRVSEPECCINQVAGWLLELVYQQETRKRGRELGFTASDCSVSVFSDKK